MIIRLFLIFSVFLMLFNATPVYSEQSCSRMEFSVQVIDASKNKILPLVKLNQIGNMRFRHFVDVVFGYIQASIPHSQYCSESDQLSPVSLTFVYQPLVGSTYPIDSISMDRGSQYPVAHCQVDSPWVKFYVSPSPSPTLNGVFIWSEGQILFDQALLEKPEITKTSSTEITPKRFNDSISAYTDHVLLADSPEAKSKALIDLSNQLPPELFWLFTRAWQSTKLPFVKSVNHELSLTLEHIESQYIELNQRLIDNCFKFSDQKYNYRYITEISSILDIDSFKLKRLH